MFGVLAVISSVFVFWVWSERIPAVLSAESRILFSLVYPLAGLCISGACFALAALFVRNTVFIYTTAVLLSSAPYFLLPPSITALYAILGTIFLAVFAVRRIRGEYALSLGFSSSKILREGLPIYFTTASLIISVFYFFQLNTTNATEALIPRPALNYTLHALTTNSFLAGSLGLPEVDPESTVDQALFSSIDMQLTSRGISLKEIPKADFERLLNEERNALAQQFGITLTGKEKVGDVFNQAVTIYMSRLLGPYQEFLPFASAAAFFLAFKTITIPLYYATLLLTFILIKLLLYGTILKKVAVTIDTEKIAL